MLDLSHGRGAAQDDTARALADELSRLALVGALTAELSHQLNNKLSPLLGYAQLLDQAGGLDEESGRRLDRILEASRDMEQMISRMRQVRRRGPMAREPVSLERVIEAAVRTLRPRFEDQGVHINMESLGELPPAVGDMELLLETLLAVLHCAATGWESASGSERWVQIDAAARDGMIQVVIEDNGAPPDFFDGSEKEASGGQGVISYNMARNHVRRHKGRFGLEPRQNGGKRVVMELPIAERVAADATQ